MKRKSWKQMPCSIARALDVVGEHWSLLVIRDAFTGVRRFEEFQESLGVARNVLAARLRRLVAKGVLERRDYQVEVLDGIREDLLGVVSCLTLAGEDPVRRAAFVLESLVGAIATKGDRLARRTLRFEELVGLPAPVLKEGVRELSRSRRLG